MSKKIKISLIVMLIVSVAIVLIASAFGLSTWRDHMVMGIDSDASYLFGETDLTDPVNYQIVTNTYLTGFVMVELCSLVGIYIDAVMWALYGFGILCIKAVKKMKTQEAEAQSKSKQERIDTNAPKTDTR